MSTIKSSAEDLILNADGASSEVKIQQNGTTAITIDSSENVGIGITNPTSKLHLYGAGTTITIDNSGETEGGILFRDGNAAAPDAQSAAIMFDSGSAISNNALSLYVNDYQDGESALALRLTSDGRGLSEFTAKAWCQISGGAQTLSSGHNVSSVVDDGTGKGTINFAVNMTDSNYAVASHTEDGSGFNDSPTINRDGTQTRSTSQFQYYTYMNGALNDAVDTSFIFFGE